jgi:hypothetical protein
VPFAYEKVALTSPEICACKGGLEAPGVERAAILVQDGVPWKALDGLQEMSTKEDQSELDQCLLIYPFFAVPYRNAYLFSRLELVFLTS